jgi:hypothetical protein
MAAMWSPSRDDRSLAHSLATLASDTFVVGAKAQRRVIRCVWDHNNVGFTTPLITLFRRGGPSGERHGVAVQACQIMCSPVAVPDMHT